MLETTVREGDGGVVVVVVQVQGARQAQVGVAEREAVTHDSKWRDPNCRAPLPRGKREYQRIREELQVGRGMRAICKQGAGDGTKSRLTGTGLVHNAITTVGVCCPRVQTSCRLQTANCNDHTPMRPNDLNPGPGLNRRRSFRNRQSSQSKFVSGSSRVCSESSAVLESKGSLPIDARQREGEKEADNNARTPHTRDKEVGCRGNEGRRSLGDE